MQTRILFNRADLDDPGRDLTRRIGGEAGAWDIAVINGCARRFWTRSAGAFSVKWMAQGRACYRLDGRPHVVSRTAAVLVDQDQPYEMEFDGRVSSQSFCLFYAPALAAEAWASLAAGFHPEPEPVAAEAFPNVVFQPSADLGRTLGALSEDGPTAPPAEMEARLLTALEAALATAQGHRRLLRRLPGARPSTRAHALGLLERARGRIAEADGVGVSLDQAASAAGMSKFHFLRLFKAAYGASPLAYAEQRRMIAARSLLRGAQPVGEIAARLGYDSPSAFARAFRRHAGVAPAAFRARAAN